MNKNLLKILYVVIVVAVIAIAAFFFLKPKQSDHNQVAEKILSVDKKQLALSEIPKGFPSNLPTESGATVLQNYEAKTNDFRLQSTRVTTTKKTLADATKVYTDFFSKLNWKIVPNQPADADTITTLMIKGNDSLLIVATDANPDKQNTIGLTLTQSGVTE